MISLTVFVVFASIAVLVQGDDAPCLEMHGKCQSDNSYCCGWYQSGLCSGPINRRCCVPTSFSACNRFETVTRSEWEARTPRGRSRRTSPVNKFFIHHTAGNTCSDKSSCIDRMQQIQDDHMDRRSLRWNDIGYNFLVGGDGRVYIGRGWETVGAHTENYNSNSYGVSFIGNFMNSLPTSWALSAARNLIECGVETGRLTYNYRLFGHRSAGNTDCPGDALLEEIRTWPHYSTSDP